MDLVAIHHEGLKSLGHTRPHGDRTPCRADGDLVTILETLQQCQLLTYLYEGFRHKLAEPREIPGHAATVHVLGESISCRHNRVIGVSWLGKDGTGVDINTWVN